MAVSTEQGSRSAIHSYPASLRFEKDWPLRFTDSSHKNVAKIDIRGSFPIFTFRY